MRSVPDESMRGSLLVATPALTEPTFAREWGDYFTRTRMPALRIDDFNMSSVSQAS